jgi:hypothetical protein
MEGSVFPAHTNTGDPNSPFDAWRLINRTRADPGGTTVSRVATLHMLRSAISNSLRSRDFIRKCRA